jgi:hypothetical protein
MSLLEVVHTIYGIVVGGRVLAQVVMPLWWVAWTRLMTAAEGLEMEKMIGWWWRGSM